MSGYLAIFMIRARSLLQYRAASFASIVTQLFWAMIQGMIFHAFYAQKIGSVPISLAHSITFIWLGQSLIQLLPFSIDKEIEIEIKHGDVAYELVRPLNLYGLWFTRSLAMRVVLTLMRCAPLLLIGGLFFGLQAPQSWEAGTFFFCSVIAALFLSAAITTLVTISLFWTISGEGILRLLPHCSLFLSGMTVPLLLFPAWAQPFLNIQPLRGVMDIPCRLYTGIIPPSDAIYYLGFQIGWTAVLVLLGMFLMRRAMRHFVILGG